MEGHGHPALIGEGRANPEEGKRVPTGTVEYTGVGSSSTGHTMYFPYCTHKYGGHGKKRDSKTLKMISVYPCSSQSFITLLVCDLASL